jgi:hypothetical protein
LKLFQELGERGWRRVVEGVNSSMIYLIYCKKLCKYKCHNVPAPNIPIKEKEKMGGCCWEWFKRGWIWSRYKGIPTCLCSFVQITRGAHPRNTAELRGPGKIHSRNILLESPAMPQTLLLQSLTVSHGQVAGSFHIMWETAYIGKDHWKGPPMWLKPEFWTPGPNSWDSTCQIQPLTHIWQVKKHGESRERFILLHSSGHVMGRGRVSTQSIFSHLLGTEMSYRFK